MRRSQQWGGTHRALRRFLAPCGLPEARFPGNSPQRPPISVPTSVPSDGSESRPHLANGRAGADGARPPGPISRPRSVAIGSHRASRSPSRPPTPATQRYLQPTPSPCGVAPTRARPAPRTPRRRQSARYRADPQNSSLHHPAELPTPLITSHAAQPCRKWAAIAQFSYASTPRLLAAAASLAGLRRRRSHADSRPPPHSSRLGVLNMAA